MSRFGVVSLLLVLFLDFGRSFAPGCNHVYDKLKVHEDESSFRDNSQPVFREVLRPFATGSAPSENAAIFRKLYATNDGLEKPGLVEEHGFRNPLEQLFFGSNPQFGHRATLKRASTVKPQQTSTKDKTRRKGKEENRQSPSMMHNLLEKVVSSPSFCKYVQTVLRKIIDIAG